MDEKIKGMEDFKLSCDFAKSLNHTLQEKMLEANEERAAALFTKQKIEEIAQDWRKMEEDDDVFGSKKAGEEDVMENAVLDQEVDQMEKAIKVLMGEYAKRKAIRDRTKAAAGAVTKRIAALMVFQKKKEAFSKIKQTQLDEIEEFKKKKEEYHLKQREIEKQKEKEEEVEKQKEKELEEKRKKEQKESMSSMGRDKLDSCTSDEGLDFPTTRRRGFNRQQTLNKIQSVSALSGSDQRKALHRMDTEFMDDDVFGNANQRKDSKKTKEKETKKGKQPDLSRAAHTINNVFYWDRQQNLKNNTTFGGRYINL